MGFTFIKVRGSHSCDARLSCLPCFSRCSFASWILTGTHQQSCSHHFCRHADLIIDLDAQVFSRRFPWHPQGRLLLYREILGPPPRWSTVFFVDLLEECMEMSLADV